MRLFIFVENVPERDSSPGVVPRGNKIVRGENVKKWVYRTCALNAIMGHWVCLTFSLLLLLGLLVLLGNQCGLLGERLPHQSVRSRVRRYWTRQHSNIV